MRSWRTYSTLGWAARRRKVVASSCRLPFGGLRADWKKNDGSDAEVLVTPGEAGAGGGDAGFGVAGDGGVTIEDEVAVGSDAGCVDLRGGQTGKEEGQDEGSLEAAAADPTPD